MAIYIIEENHLGQVTQQAFNSMPTLAIPILRQKCVAHPSAKDNQTDRCVGSGDQHKDHHMVYLPENTERPASDIQRMIGGAGTVKKNMLSMNIVMAGSILAVSDKADFTRRGAAAKTVSIIAMKWVMALPGSRIVICIIDTSLIQ